jgi:hypothetical protein
MLNKITIFFECLNSLLKKNNNFFALEKKARNPANKKKII